MFDTPETYRPKSEAERHHGHLAKDFVLKACPVGSSVVVKTHKDKTGKYGRYLADVMYWVELDDNLRKIQLSLVEQLKENGLEKLDDYSNYVIG